LSRPMPRASTDVSPVFSLRSSRLFKSTSHSSGIPPFLWDSKSSRLSRGLATFSSNRKHIPIRRPRQLDRIDHTRKHPVVADGRRHLQQPLEAVAVFEGVERLLLDPVLAEELLDVGDDLSLFGLEL